MSHSMPGIYVSGTHWMVDKWVHGNRLRERFSSYRDASEWLTKRLAEIDRVKRFGETPQITFAQAVQRRLQEKLDAGMPSAESDSYHLGALLPYVGHLNLSQMSDASFDDFRAQCARENKAAKTEHLSLSSAQAILNQAASKWRAPGSNQPYLQNPPRLTLPTLVGRQRKPRPITWDEQDRLIEELPTHLQGPALFSVNTGARDAVVVNFQWSWLLDIPRPAIRVAAVPKEFVKGRREPKLLILNQIALEVIEAQRGLHPDYVFVCTRRSKRTPTSMLLPTVGPFETINNTAWQSARVRAGLGDLHGHDLRHTFAHRLAAAGVAEADIASLLWHSASSITQHYMGKHLLKLQAAVEMLVDRPEDEDISVAALLADRFRVRPGGA